MRILYLICIGVCSAMPAPIAHFFCSACGKKHRSCRKYVAQGESYAWCGMVQQRMEVRGDYLVHPSWFHLCQHLAYVDNTDCRIESLSHRHDLQSLASVYGLVKASGSMWAQLENKQKSNIYTPMPKLPHGSAQGHKTIPRPS